MFRYVDVLCLCLSICILKNTRTERERERERERTYMHFYFLTFLDNIYRNHIYLIIIVEPPDIEVPSGKEGDTGQWYTDDIVQAMEYLKVVDTRRTALRLRAKRSHVLLAYSTLPGM